MTGPAKRIRTIFVVVLTVTISAVLAGPARANTVTIGSSLTDPNNAFTVLGGIGVELSQSAAANPLPLTSPANGLVTGWAVRSTASGFVYSLRVLHPLGGLSYVPTGTSTNPTPSPGGGTGGVVLPYPASLPIMQGDAIGLGVANGIPVHVGGPLTAGDVFGRAPATPDGSTATFTTSTMTELLVQATIKFCQVPSLLGLKRANALQKLAAADCAGTVKKKKVKRTKKNMKRKKGRVLNQSLSPGQTAAPGTAVTIAVGKLKKR